MNPITIKKYKMHFKRISTRTKKKKKGKRIYTIIKNTKKKKKFQF